MNQLLASKFTGVVIFFSLLLLSFTLLEFNSGLTAPQPIGAFLNGKMPTRGPVSGNFEVVEAFPNITFNNPIYMTHHPKEDRMLVTTWDGLIYHFPNNRNVTTKTLFADLRDRSAPLRGGNLLGFTFHPEFGQAGSPNRNYVYIYYAAKGLNGESQPTTFESYVCPDASRYYGTFMRLSRFEVNSNFTLNKGSELRMINYRLANNSHRGGGMVFGNDGFLYLTLGDQSRMITAQNITDYFEGGVIRIDVNQDPTKSHAPIRKLGQGGAGTANEYSGRGYWIPNDNPFISPNGQLFEEFYAVGLRNPFKMTKDRLTGEMWIGDVGHDAREEVDILQKGANFGWPRYEGLLEGTVTQCNSNQLTLTHGTYVPPVIDFDRNEAASITGGYVYRGNNMTGLVGKYIWADHAKNIIYAVSRSGGTFTNTQISTFTPGSASSFGEDINGELYMCKVGNNTKIYKLQEVPSTSDAAFNPPTLLSQTGAFSNLSNLTPAQGVLPYDMVESFWSDGADKKRWVSIPNDGTHNTPAEKIKFSEQGDWELPVGAVVIKHFDYKGRKLETRFEIHGNDGNYYYLTYKWNSAGTNATLLNDALDERLTVGGETITWHYPSRSECIACHQKNAGNVIGLKTRYLNKDFTYPSTGVRANQLVTLSTLGILDRPINDAQASTFLTAAAKNDNAASLEFRARSYLDLNCSYCHRPETGNRANFNALLTAPLSSQELINGNVINELGIPGSKIIFPGNPSKSVLHRRLSEANTNISMPPLAKLKVDNEGLALIRDWINSLSSTIASTPFPKVISFTKEQNDNPASDLIDGSINAEDRWSAEGFPQSVVIDYGVVQNIVGTRLWTYQNRAYQYTVEVSNAPTSGFRQIVNRSRNTTGVSPISDNFSTQSGRYVRITVTGASGYTGPWVSLREFEIITEKVNTSSADVIFVSEEQNINLGTGLVDGSLDAEDRWSAEGFPQTIVLDYRDLKEVTGTKLWTYQNRAYQYTVEISTDGCDYKRIVDRSANRTSGAPLTNNFSAQIGRYIRITVTGASGYTGPWVSLREFKIITPTTGSTDTYPQIASVSKEQGINPAIGLIDGSKAANDRWSAEGFPQEIVIDYGAPLDISSTRLWAYENRAYQYTVEVSYFENCGYELVVNRRTNTTGASPIVDNFPTKKGRYVRIKVVGASGYTGPWVSLIEFEIVSNGSVISRNVTDKSLSVKPALGNKAALDWYHLLPNNGKVVVEYTIQHYVAGKEALVDIETFVPTDDNEDQIVAYQYLHDTPSIGENFYQIKILYENETVEYSKLQQVTFEKKPAEITIAPNPTRGTLRLDLSNYPSKNINYFITTFGGQILQKGIFKEDHPDTETVNLELLPNGIYLIYIKPENEKALAQKLVIAKDY